MPTNDEIQIRLHCVQNVVNALEGLDAQERGAVLTAALSILDGESQVFETTEDEDEDED